MRGDPSRQITSSVSRTEGFGSETPARAARETPGRGAHRTEAYLDRGDVRLYHSDWLPEAPPVEAFALVVLMHGYGEHCRRYDELAEFLSSRGLGVFMLDARGHGRSGGQRGHIRDYAEYIADLIAFVQDVEQRYPGHPRVLLGHSNGGLIAIRAVQQGLGGLSGLVVTSPLLELRPRKKPLPDAIARCLSWAVARLPLPNGIVARDLTHDQRIVDAHGVDPWVHRYATPRWYWSMTMAGRQALADAELIRLPLLVVSGELDPIVEPARGADFYARAGSLDKLLVTRTGELHEVLNEVERRALFVLIADWVERVARKDGSASEPTAHVAASSPPI